MSALDIEAIEIEARTEVNNEVVEKAKGRLKGKMKEIAAAELVVENLKRELQHIKDEIGAGLV